MTGSGSKTLSPRAGDGADRVGAALSTSRRPWRWSSSSSCMPVLFTGWMSLHNWPLMGGIRAGSASSNYVRMFNDARFMSALQFTAYYTVIVTIAIFAVAFPLAIFVEKQRRFVSAYRTIIFLPVVVGLATASLLWVWLANVDSGFFGPALRRSACVDKSPNLLADLRHRLSHHHRHGGLEDRRLHHDHPADRPAGHPVRADGGGPHRRRRTLAALPASDACR